MVNTSQENNSEETRKGRGWKGDSDGHARAGRLGGLARSRRKSKDSSPEENNS
jgi:hypothetical protein